jgi:ABC-type transporter Mla MlaB component
VTLALEHPPREIDLMAGAVPHGEDETAGPVSNQISGGVFFHAVIQGRNITVQLPPQTTSALSGLPPASSAFTGRDEQVEELLGTVAGARPQQAVLVAAVAGLGGIGKTELVVQTAARALKQPGWFPGGVLFVDMFGYDQERWLAPERALGSLLRALGVPKEQIPSDLQDLSRLYRSALAALAHAGSRVLVVIDNVSSADQVRPLLPTDGITAALVTSRDTLDLDARLFDLGTLSDSASVGLLDRVLREARGPGDTRIHDEPEEAVALAQLCGGLPLALRIAASLLVDYPTRPLSSVTQALGVEQSRLHRLRRKDRAVRATFDLSYRRLSLAHQRFFRLLPLNPGPDISTEAALHLSGLDAYETEELLQDLARCHLIEPGVTWGRWRLHDLVRLYASELGIQQANVDRRDAVQYRLHGHYVEMARAARSHLAREPLTPLLEPRSPRFTTSSEAEGWFEQECQNLIALIAADPVNARSRTVILLAAFLTPYLRWEGRFRDMETVVATVETLARERADSPLRMGMALLMISYELDRMDFTYWAVDLLVDAIGFLCECHKRNLEVIAVQEIHHHLLKIIRRAGVLPTGIASKLDQLTLTHAHVVPPEHTEGERTCWCRQCWLQRIGTTRLLPSIISRPGVEPFALHRRPLPS